MPRTVRPPATCHPHRKEKADGLCLTCLRTRTAHRYRLRTVYGITEEDYQRMFKAQGGVCAICRRHQRKQRLSVDHDHKTQRIRGLLCTKCNRALGKFEWDKDILKRLVAYARAIIRDHEAAGL